MYKVQVIFGEEATSKFVNGIPLGIDEINYVKSILSTLLLKYMLLSKAWKKLLDGEPTTTSQTNVSL